MTRVKEAIEEIIEESYLMGLSEQEICEDFRRFIDTCYEVLYKNLKNREALNGLAETLEREQTFVLMADYAEERRSQLGEDSSIKSLDEIFAEKAARRKRQILRTIAQYDPQLVRLIDAHRFQGEIKEPAHPRRTAWRARWRPDWDRVRLQLLKVGYCATIGLIVLLLYLGFVART
jgi:hypothetical protein